jgi:hypothetical protein
MNNIIISLKLNGIDFKSEGKTLFNLNIPLNVMDDMEVRDSVTFDKILSDSLKAHKISAGKCTLSLSNEIVFSKTVVTEEEKTKFFEEIPIEPEDVIKEILPNEKQYLAIAIDKKFIYQIITSLEKLGFKIVSITPEVGNIPNKLDFTKYFPANTQKTKISRASLFAIIISVIFTISALIGLIYFFITK